MKKTQEKINPVIKNQKAVKDFHLEGKNDSEDESVIKNFIIITIVIAILIGIVYGATELLKDEEVIEDPPVAGSINYDKISVGTLLNRPYDEYYVLAYGADDPNAVLYSTIMTSYMQTTEEEDYIKIYFCDLDNTLNQKYYNVNEDDKSNPKAKSIEELDFGKLTLLKIKNGKITEYIEDLEKIKETL